MVFICNIKNSAAQEIVKKDDHELYKLGKKILEVFLDKVDELYDRIV